MAPFNIFQAFSRSSRDSDGRTTRRPRRLKIIKPMRRHAEPEYAPEQAGQVRWYNPGFLPGNDRQPNPYYEEEYLGRGHMYHTQSARPQSPIPAVHREDSHSRLHDMFDLQGDSEEGDLAPPIRRPLVHAYSHSHLARDHARTEIPVRLDSFHGGYQDAHEPVRQGRRHSSQYRDFYPDPVHTRQPRPPALPTFVRVGDENKVVIRECDDYRDVWEDQVYPQDSDSVETCYIVPPGVNVIFEDEYGNEITRVGDFGPRAQPSRRRPFIIQDEDGHVLYRSGDSSTGSQSSRLSDTSSYDRTRRRHRHQLHSGFHTDATYSSRFLQHEQRQARRSSQSSDYAISNSSLPTAPFNIILIDEKGRQINIASATGSEASAN